MAYFHSTEHRGGCRYFAVGLGLTTSRAPGAHRFGALSCDPIWVACSQALQLLPSLPLTWHLTGGPLKRKMIFQVPSSSCYVSGREGNRKSVLPFVFPKQESVHEKWTLATCSLESWASPCQRVNKDTSTSARRGPKCRVQKKDGSRCK